MCVCLSPDEAENIQTSGDAGEEDRKPRRKAYVHKPFLYSRYYSDSDDEITVEERRRSAVGYININIKGAALAEHFCFNSIYSKVKGHTESYGPLF